MKQPIKISVVIPLYNKQAYILDAIASIFSQSYQAHEIVIVDDGSTDYGPDMVAEKIETDQDYDKVVLIRQKNAGVSVARNTAIENASGTHIAFLDADDIWHKDFLKEIASLIGMFPESKAFGTAYEKFFPSGEVVSPKIRISPKPKESMLIEDYFAIASRGDLPFFTSSVCVERALLLEVGGFPVGEPMGEDQDVFAKVSFKSTIAYSPKVLSRYRLDADNSACSNNILREECPFSKRLHSAVVQNEVPKHMQRNVLAYTATHLLHIAKILLSVNEFKDAQKILSDSRCKLLPHKWFHLQLKLYCKQFML
ncbi:Putative glycosyltransferase EpsH [Thalassocella blandensis]|nr:Putative glycosyltransferase EpsH [Thalassocella blandensis]